MNGADCLRVGIYGGTFAPVHNGHVAAAKAFMEQMKLDYLFIIPTCIPPHKQVDFADDPLRSEEHTSELQSRGTISYAVFCL